MRKKLAFLFALIGWFAIIAQFCLMMQNRVASIPETMLRFFSFFTITTNTLVAVYFTAQLLGKTVVSGFDFTQSPQRGKARNVAPLLRSERREKYWKPDNTGKPTGFLNKPGTLTAITVYITVVGLVYQFALRHIWHPKGLQMIVDELLHSIIPFLVIIYWYLYEEKREIKYVRLFRWLLYPSIYLVYIMDRGYFTGFYPYPFINVTELGVGKTVLHCGLMLLLFIALAFIYIRIGKAIAEKRL